MWLVKALRDWSGSVLDPGQRGGGGKGPVKEPPPQARRKTALSLPEAGELEEESFF